MFWPAILIFMGHLGILLFVWMLCWLSHVIVANISLYALRAGSEDGYLHSFGEKPVSGLLPHGKNWKIHYVVACFYMMITCSLMLPSFLPLCVLYLDIFDMRLIYKTSFGELFWFGWFQIRRKRSITRQ